LKKLSFKTTFQLRCIINAVSISNAKIILNDLVHRLDVVNNSLTKLKRYEDDYHYEFSISVEISAETFSELEHKSFKLCTTIVNGPWLFLKLPKDENEFEFEAIFNQEAFIHHSIEYNNKLKWAHLEIN
jgi:hypothetical protein